MALSFAPSIGNSRTTGLHEYWANQNGRLKRITNKLYRFSIGITLSTIAETIDVDHSSCRWIKSLIWTWFLKLFWQRLSNEAGKVTGFNQTPQAILVKKWQLSTADLTTNQVMIWWSNIQVADLSQSCRSAKVKLLKLQSSNKFRSCRDGYTAEEVAPSTEILFREENSRTSNALQK